LCAGTDITASDRSALPRYSPYLHGALGGRHFVRKLTAFERRFDDPNVAVRSGFR
jgi:hypothetical protein